MLSMQEEGKLLSRRLALRGYRSLEKIMLNVLRKPAPHCNQGYSQGATYLLFGF
jgi:hypothetical protein